MIQYIIVKKPDQISFLKPMSPALFVRYAFFDILQ